MSEPLISPNLWGEWRVARWRDGAPAHHPEAGVLGIPGLYGAPVVASTPQVEAVLGVLLSGLYVFYYFCAASVSCPPLDRPLEVCK